MSDGVEEKKREGETNRKKSVACPDDYSCAVARVVVAQVCETIGFEGVKHSALDSLSDITVRYICDLAESARYYANLSGRSESNVFDIVKGLEDLSASRGFMGASSFDCCSTASGALKELVDYVATSEEIPFAQPIPRFPVSGIMNSSSSEVQSSSELGEISSRKHIPEWLPEFPEPHTFLHSAVWNERRADTRIDNTEHVRQRRKAESSLLRLQQRLLAYSSPPSSSANGVEGSEAMEVFNLSPATPLPAGEKEASQVSVPTKLVNTEPNKKHRSFVDIFAPAIDAVKGRGEVDSMEVDRGAVFEKRPVINFRLKTGKKMRSEDVDVSLRGRGEERVPVLGMDEERDEKKRRAEQILRQSMASAQEMANNVN